MTVLTFPAPKTMPATSSVSAIATGDGLVVRLTGHLTSRDVPSLRTVLLGADTPTMVLIDAACVSGADADVLAVLTAAAGWATSRGGRLLYVTVAASLQDALSVIVPGSQLPLLPAPARPAANVLGLRRLDSTVRVVA